MLGVLALATAFNNPPSVPTWCGKAYMATWVLDVSTLSAGSNLNL